MKYPGIKRISKGKYRIRVTATCAATGKRKEADRIVECDSLQDAEGERVKLRDELLDEREPVERPTVRDYGNKWFERNAKKWAYSTRLRHAAHLDKIIDDLGDIYLDSVLPGDVKGFLERLEQAGYSTRTVNGALRVARTMLRDGKADFRLPGDPCERVKEVTVDGEERDDGNGNVLTGEELHALFDHLEHPFKLIAFTMGATGLRFCHASALRWEDLDLDAGVVRPKMTQYRGQVSRIGGKSKKKTPKSIPLAPQLVAMLVAHRRRLVEGQHPGLAEGWVFPRPNGRTFYTGDLNAPIQAALKAAGISKRFTPHGLRRSFNNLARQETADAIVIRSITGHSTEQMTERYSHVGIDEKRRLVNAVVGRIRKCGDQSGDQGEADAETKNAAPGKCNQDAAFVGADGRI